MHARRNLKAIVIDTLLHSVCHWITALLHFVDEDTCESLVTLLVSLVYTLALINSPICMLIPICRLDTVVPISFYLMNHLGSSIYV